MLRKLVRATYFGRALVLFESNGTFGDQATIIAVTFMDLEWRKTAAFGQKLEISLI